MFEHIMVPLDGTELAEQALIPAVSLGRERDSHLHLATVVRPPRTESSELTAGLSDSPAEDDYMEAVAARVRDAGASNVSTARLSSDNIVDALEAHRKELGADLTVICTHGHGSIKRAWLGSVADGLVRTSDAPVLLVRAAPAGEARGSEIRTDMSFDRVLVALDGSHFSRQAFGPATRLAGSSDTEFILARIIEASGVGARSAMTGQAVTDERLQQARTLAEAKLNLEVQSFAPDGHSVEAVVELAPSVAQGILDLAQSRGADVIVIATHGRSGIQRLVLGSVADKVIRGADLPVLVVRPQGP
jgi:nucleotide-binding universal stress UspA family protein